jgi:hypothetical protein
MPVSNITRRSGPRRSALVVAGLAAALTLGGAASLGGPAAQASPDAGATPSPTTVVTTIYQVTPTPIPVPDVVVHKVVAGGGENENEKND